MIPKIRKIIFTFFVLLLLVSVGYASDACTDSDGGDNSYERGITRGAHSGNANRTIKDYEDYCVFVGKNMGTKDGIVSENYCKDNLVESKYIDCSYGCKDGACLRQSLSNWICVASESPYGDIRITYTNENAANKAEIFGIVPQKHPIIYPGGELLLALHSKKCFEYTIKIKDSSNRDVAQYSAKPYSPYPECNIPPDELPDILEKTIFLTNIVFIAPQDPGSYTLEIYDPQNVLLTIGAIQILDPRDIISSVESVKLCDINPVINLTGDSNYTLDYTLVLQAPYPVVVELDKPGEISVIIKGPDSAIINKMFDQISLMIEPPPGEAVVKDIKTSSAKSGTPVCSDGQCTQKFSLTSTRSTYAVVTVLKDESTAENSGAVSILAINDLIEIRSELNELSSTALGYVEYYTSINEYEKAKSWQVAYDKINSMLSYMDSLVSILESKNFKIADVIYLISFIDESQKNIDAIISSISGV